MKHFAIFIVSLFLLLAIPSSRAVASWVDDDYAASLEAAEDGAVSSPAYASHMSTNQMADIIRKILGPVPGITVTADAWQRNPEYVKKMAQGAAVGQVANYIAMIYTNPPASTYAFVRDTAQTLGFIPKQAYAQGVGFSGLAALLPIWKAFRNIAYAVLAILMIVIGFMVMLRKKIDPKTVVTVQNALPRIVVTLLLITFSYAIVGLLVDLMYLLILLLLGVFSQSGLLKITPAASSAFVNGSLGEIFSTQFPNGVFTIGNIVLQIMGPAVAGGSAIIGALIGMIIAGSASFGALTLFGGIAGAVVGGAAPSIIVTLLVSLILFFAYVRLFFSLFNAFLQVLLGLLLGPLQLLLEAVPGANGFASWITNIISNLIAFPIAAALFLLSYSFSSMVISSPDQPIWSPPFLIGSSANSDTVVGLFSLGILLLAPQIINSMKEAFKVKPVLPIGSAFGQAASAPLSTGMQILSAGYYLRAITSKNVVEKIAPKQPQKADEHTK